MLTLVYTSQYKKIKQLQQIAPLYGSKKSIIDAFKLTEMQFEQGCNFVNKIQKCMASRKCILIRKNEDGK